MGLRPVLALRGLRQGDPVRRLPPAYYVIRKQGSNWVLWQEGIAVLWAGSWQTCMYAATSDPAYEEWWP